MQNSLATKYGATCRSQTANEIDDSNTSRLKKKKMKKGYIGDKKERIAIIRRKRKELWEVPGIWWRLGGGGGGGGRERGFK